MKRNTWIMLMLLLLVACLIVRNPVVTTSATYGRPEANTSHTAAGYREIAQYISRRVLALKGKVAGFQSINASKHIYLWERPFKPVVAYNYGVTKWEPVADAEPPMNQAVYSNHGFTVVIWMVEGDLTWSPPRPPVKVGKYTVSAELAGPQQARIQPLIDGIVADAANRFNR